MVFDSPRNRRLQADLEAMNKLKAESSIIEFTAQGDPVERYIITFHGKGISDANRHALPAVCTSGVTVPNLLSSAVTRVSTFHSTITADSRTILSDSSLTGL